MGLYSNHALSLGVPYFCSPSLSSVGKTSLITRFMYDSFDNTYQVGLSGTEREGGRDLCACKKPDKLLMNLHFFSFRQQLELIFCQKQCTWKTEQYVSSPLTSPSSSPLLLLSHSSHTPIQLLSNHLCQVLPIPLSTPQTTLPVTLNNSPELHSLSYPLTHPSPAPCPEKPSLWHCLPLLPPLPFTPTAVCRTPLPACQVPSKGWLHLTKT